MVSRFWGEAQVNGAVGNSWELEGTLPRFFMHFANSRFLSMSCRNFRSSRSRRGFTLIEALASLTILVLAGGVMLMAVETMVQSNDDAIERTIAEGIARQIVDEVMGKRYKATTVGPYQYPLGPSGWEANGNGRERFDDTDDFHHFSAKPAEDIWGKPLGAGDDQGGWRHGHFRVAPGYFNKWKQKIKVYYVNDNNLAQRLNGSNTSNHRAVEVTILRQQNDGAFKEIANVRRVYAYVPVPN